MPQKNLDRPSMSEVLCAPRLTKVKSKFLDEIDARVNWQPISKLLNKKLLNQETDVAGQYPWAHHNPSECIRYKDARSSSEPSWDVA